MFTDAVDGEEGRLSDTSVNRSSNDRLLDGHHHLVQMLTIWSVERDSATVKVKRAEYAD